SAEKRRGSRSGGTGVPQDTRRRDKERGQSNNGGTYERRGSTEWRSRPEEGPGGERRRGAGSANQRGVGGRGRARETGEQRARDRRPNSAATGSPARQDDSDRVKRG